MPAPATRMVEVVPLKHEPSPLSILPPESEPHLSTRRLAQVLAGFSTSHAHYPIAKFIEFDAYRRTAPRWRIAAVLVLTPVPALAIVLLTSLIPLQDPNLGLRRNWGFFAHFAVNLLAINLGTNLLVREGGKIAHADFSSPTVLVSAVLTIPLVLAITALLGHVWRFPVPFLSSLIVGPWCLCLLGVNALLLRAKLARLGAPVRRVLPSLTLQSAQVIIYPMFSAIFEAANEWQRVCLMLGFPVLKYFIKKTSRRLWPQGDESAEEMAVGGTEICAAMYQATIMQSAPSRLATALVIGIDVLQGLLAIALFMDKSSRLSHTELLERALEYVISPEGSRRGGDIKTHNVTLADVGAPGTWMPGLVDPRRAASATVHPVNDIPQHDDGQRLAQLPDEQRVVVVHALECLLRAESILLVEYIEVMIPMLNVLYLLGASHVDSARFNRRLTLYYEDDAALYASLRGLMLYTTLQGLSVMAMTLVLARRFRLAATTQLAFVLERYWWSFQGRMMSWVPAIIHIMVLHYGVDFSFRFQFALPTDAPSVT